jgi:hypothetical protein
MIAYRLRGLALALFMARLVGCSSPTVPHLELEVDSSGPTPDTLEVRVYDRFHELASERISRPTLPGNLRLTDLPSQSNQLRIVVLGLDAALKVQALDGAALATPTPPTSALALHLSSRFADRDGDGVPDVLDDCPTVADLAQSDASGFGNGPGDACTLPDGGNCLPALDGGCPAGQSCVAGFCQCPSGQVECGGACVDPSTNTQFCGASGDCRDTQAGVACSATEPVCNHGHCAPAICTAGSDPVTAAALWVVCGYDNSGVWMSHNNARSTFHIDAICRSIGYHKADAYGGNCGSVCGYCDGAHSCMQPDAEPPFDGNVQQSDGATCGTSDVNGFIVCGLPTWHCS